MSTEFGIDLGIEGLKEIEAAVGLVTDLQKRLNEVSPDKLASGLTRIAKQLDQLDVDLDDAGSRFRKLYKGIQAESETALLKAATNQGILGAELRKAVADTKSLALANADYDKTLKQIYATTTNAIAQTKARTKAIETAGAAQARYAELQFEAAKKATHAEAERKMGITDLTKEQGKLSASLAVSTARIKALSTEEGKAALIAAEKVKVTEKSILADTRRDQALKELNAQFVYSASVIGRHVSRVKQGIKEAESAAVADMKRSEALRNLTGALNFAESAEGKSTARLKESIKQVNASHVAVMKRKQALAELVAQLKLAESAEGKRTALLKDSIKQVNLAHTADRERKRELAALKAELKTVSSDEGKRTAVLKETIKQVNATHVAEMKRTQALTALKSELTLAQSAEGKRTAILKESIAQANAAHVAELKRSQTLTALKTQLEFALSAEGKRVATLKESIKQVNAAQTVDMRRAKTLHDLRSELAYLSSEQGKATSALKYDIAEQAKANTETKRREAATRKLIKELEYLKTEEGKAYAAAQQNLTVTKALAAEESDRAIKLARLDRALSKAGGAELKATAIAEARVEVLKRAAKEEAELIVVGDKHTQQLKRAKDELAYLKSAEGQRLISLQKQIAATKAATAETVKYSGMLGTLTLAYKRLGAAQVIVANSTAGFRAGLQGAGAGMGIFTSSTILFASAVFGTVRAFKAAMDAGREYEATMDRVKAVMTASAGDSAALESRVRSLAATSVFTASEVSQGMLFLGMSGQTAKQALVSIEPSLQLASIGMLDMGTTADIVTNILYGFGLESEQLAEIVSDMATAVTSSNMDIRQLGNAMSYVAPLTRDADVSLQEIVATLEVLHNAGIKSQRAGTAMRTTMLTLGSASKEGSKILREHGIVIDDQYGKMRNWTSILKQLAAAQLTSSELLELVGKRHVASAKAMVDSAKVTGESYAVFDQFGTEVETVTTKLEQLTRQLYYNKDAAAGLKDQIEDNLNGDWAKFLAAVEEKFLQFYESNRERFRSMVQHATRFIESLDTDKISKFFNTLISGATAAIRALIALKAAHMGFNVGQSAGGLIGATIGAISPIPGGAALLGTAGAAIGGGVAALAAGSAVYEGMSGAEAFVDKFLGADSSAIELEVSNRMERYKDFTASKLVQMYKSQQAGITSTNAILAAAKNELEEALNSGAPAEAVNTLEIKINSLTESLNSLHASSKALTKLGQSSGLSHMTESATRAALDQAISTKQNYLAAYEKSGQSPSAAGLSQVTENLDNEIVKLTAALGAFIEVRGKAEASLKREGEVSVDRAAKTAAEVMAKYAAAEKVVGLQAEYNLALEKESVLRTRLAADQLVSDANTKETGEALLKAQTKRMSLGERLKTQQEAANRAKVTAAATELKTLQTAEKQLVAEQKKVRAAEKLNGAISYRNEMAAKGVLIANDDAYNRMQAVEGAKEQLALEQSKLDSLKETAGTSKQLLDVHGKIVEEKRELVKLAGQETVTASRQLKLLEKQAESIGQVYSTVESATIELLQNGLGDFDNYFDSIVNSFKRMLAEMVYASVLQPIMVNLVTTAGSAVGLSNSAMQSFAKSQGVTLGGVSGAYGGGADAGYLGAINSGMDLFKGGSKTSNLASLTDTFSKSKFGQMLGLSTPSFAAATSGLLSSAVAPASGTFAAAAAKATYGQGVTALGQSSAVSGTSSLAAAPALTGAGSFLKAGVQASPWGIVGSLGASALGMKGSGNAVIDTVLQTGGSIIGGAVGGTALGAQLGAAAGPVGAIVGAILGTALGGLFAKKPSDKTGTASANLANGAGSAIEVGGFTGKKFSQENRDAAKSIMTAVTDTIVPTLEEIGNTKLTGGASVNVGNRDPFKFSYAGSTTGGTRDTNTFVNNITQLLANKAGVSTAEYRALANGGELLIDTIRRVEAQVVSVSAVFEVMGDTTTVITKQFADNFTDSLKAAFGYTATQMSEALPSILESFSAVTTAFIAINKSLEVSPIAAIKSASDITEAFGGTANFNSAANDYATNFLTEDEQAASVLRQFASEVKQLGVELPATALGFRELVETVDVSTEAGIAQFAKLLSMSNSAASYYQAVEQFTLSTLQVFTAGIGRLPTDTELSSWVRTLASGAMTLGDMAAYLQEIADANTKTLTSEQQDALTPIVSGITDAYAYTVELLQEEYQIRLDAIAAEKSLLGSIGKLMDNLLLSSSSPLTPAERLAESKSQYDSLIAQFGAGDYSNAGSLQTVSQAYLSEARDFYASSDRYLSIFSEVISQMAVTEALLASRPSEEAQKLALDEEFINRQAAANDLLQQQLVLSGSSLDLQLTLLDVVSNIPAELSEAIKLVISGQALAAGLSGVTDVVPNGSHAAGLDYVPYDGYIAKLHKGERVETASNARRGDNNEALLSEIRQLRSEVSNLRADQKAHTSAIVAGNYRASEANAERVVEGSKVAAAKSEWSNKSRVTLK